MDAATLFVIFTLPAGEAYGRRQEFPSLAACQEAAADLRAKTTDIQYVCRPHLKTDALPHTAG